VPTKSSQKKTYVRCAVGFCVGVLLLILLDGPAMSLAALPIGLSIGTALRTWWSEHGWNPGITITEDAPEAEVAQSHHSDADAS